MRALGLINARGGSKGVPRKNVRSLAGKPLIAYSIEAGLAASSIARLVVSTEDDEIAKLARCAGAEVPFCRPAELASDSAIQIDVVRHAILALEAEGDRFDLIVILQPTCPTRTPADIDATVQLVIDDPETDSAISVTEVGGYHPKTYYRRDGPDTIVSPIVASDGAGVLRQDFEKVYWRNGAVYVTRADVVMRERSLYGKRTRAHVMPPGRSFNIDSSFDWALTEAWLTRSQA